MRVNVYETDVLIIGGGMAAARAAIEAACEGVEVALVAKAPVGKSGASTMAGGIIAAAMDDTDDNPATHYADTIVAGRELADPELAWLLAHEGPARIRDLAEYGVRFLKNGGELRLGSVPGHSAARILSAANGGVDFTLPLRRKALSYPNVSPHEDVSAAQLLVEDGRVVGALCFDLKTGQLAAFLARATLLATGGYQDLYPLSSASVDVTGDGYALAFEVGAEIVDLEMLLYYPTVLVSPASLLGVLVGYETLLREDGIGARIVNASGDDLLREYTPLPVRDVLSRRIFDEIRSGKGTARGGVYIDVARSPLPLAELKEWLRNSGPVFSHLTSLGIDVCASRLEVAPGAHTVLGGVRIDARCQTTVRGLFAAGEVAGNVHGANRLGANALTETQVFGQRAGLFAARFAREAPWTRISDPGIADAARSLLMVTEPKESALDPTDIKRRIRETMIECAGPTKDEKGLLEGLRRIKAIIDSDLPRLYVEASPAAHNYHFQEALEVRMMALTAWLVCHAALLRPESRGHHYRSDYAQPDESRPPYRTRLRLNDGALVADLIPVP